MARSKKPDSAVTKPTTKPIERDARGLFAKGNRGGPGRPKNSATGRKRVMEFLGDERTDEILARAYEIATTADEQYALPAIKFLWEAANGRPVTIQHEPESDDEARYTRSLEVIDGMRKARGLE